MQKYYAYAMYAMGCDAMRCDAQNSIGIARRIQAKTKAMKSSDLTRLETQKPQKPPNRNQSNWSQVGVGVAAAPRGDSLEHNSKTT